MSMNRLKLYIADILWKLPRNNCVDSELEDVLNRLMIDGCCTIDNFLSEDLVEHFVQRAGHLYDKYDRHVSYESNGSDKRLYGVDQLDKSFLLEKQLAFANKVHSEFEFCNNKAYFQMLGKISFSDGNLGSGSGWHRDSPFTHQFKVIIYLSDVGEENGPFEYVKTSHLNQSILNTAKNLAIGLDEYRFSCEQIIQMEHEGVIPQRTTIVGKKGTLLIADTRGLHRGRPLTGGQRMAITRYYFPWRVPVRFNKLYPLTVK